MSNIMNPDGTHKVIHGYSHAAGLQERDRRIAELEALYSHELSCGKTMRDLSAKKDEQIAELELELERIAAVSHHGGLLDLTITEIMSEIRRITLPHWNMEECSRLQATRGNTE